MVLFFPAVALRSRELRAQENELREMEQQEKINNFRGVFTNIRERAQLLKSKYEIRVESLTDNQVLEKLKSIRDLDDDFNKILDLICELIKVRPTNYEMSDEIINKTYSAKEKLKIMKDEYPRQNEIIQNDIYVGDCLSGKILITK